jgi:hypothetical protein
VQPRLDEAMGRRIGGSPKAQARFLDRIEGVRSPAVIEVTASPGKRSRFFVLLSLWEPDEHGGAPDRNGQLPMKEPPPCSSRHSAPRAMKSAMRPNAAELAEETLLWMIDPSRRLEVDAGDLAILLALELVSSLAAYNRAPLAVILATIATAAPTRDAILRDANRRGARPPPLSVAKLIAIAPGACRLH